MSASSGHFYWLEMYKVQLEILFGQMVIIKLNTHYSHINDDSSQYMYHPRMGQVGILTMVIDKNYAQVKFEDEASYIFPLIQVFFLRSSKDIFNEAMGCKKLCAEEVWQERV